jgi:uncharacterized membrane protein
MTYVIVNVDIKRPSSDVFAYISNFENNPKWQGGMVSAVSTSEPPFGVGSTYTQVAQFLGRRIDSKFEVIAYEAGKMVQAKTVESSFPIQFTRSVEEMEGATRVTAVIEGDASGFFKLLSPLLDLITRKSITKDYANLKHILEKNQTNP